VTTADVVGRPGIAAARLRCERMVFHAFTSEAVDEGLVVERALQGFALAVADETLQAIHEQRTVAS
jgi:hypothetical protein